MFSFDVSLLLSCRCSVAVVLADGKANKSTDVLGASQGCRAGAEDGVISSVRVETAVLRLGATVPARHSRASWKQPAQTPGSRALWGDPGHRGSVQAPPPASKGLARLPHLPLEGARRVPCAVERCRSLPASSATALSPSSSLHLRAGRSSASLCCYCCLGGQAVCFKALPRLKTPFSSCFLGGPVSKHALSPSIYSSAWAIQQQENFLLRLCWILRVERVLEIRFQAQNTAWNKD